MKVLHLISSGGMYGAESMLLNLASAQERLGCEPLLGVFENSRHPHLEVAYEARKRHLSVHVFRCAGRFDRATLSAIRGTISENGVQVIHGHGYKSNLYSYLASRQASVPFVATCHLWTGSSMAVRLYEFVDALVLRRADEVVGVSDAIAQQLRASGVPGSKISTIYNGIDLTAYADARPTLRRELGTENSILIGAVGRLEEQKGIQYLVQAAAGVVAEFPNALFLVVGDGPLRARLETLISDMGLREKVRLLGRREDMPDVYTSLDLFVLASIDEGLPMALLEALAAQLPVVATNVGAVGKLIEHEQTGLLIEARDMCALREAILRCLHERLFAHRLGCNGREHVRKQFSADQMAVSYVELYERAIARRQGRADGFTVRS